jgi:TRAP-type mannitol/chloroaromatic compound transport system permease small subunit
MPSIGFTLPHWLFWAALIVFPVIAWMMVVRTRDNPDSALANSFMAYLFWLFGGFLGMHRIYLKSYWALAYLPLFAVVIYGGAMYRDARDEHSKARQNVESLSRLTDRAKAAAARGEAGAKTRLDELEAKLAPARATEVKAGEHINRATLIMRIAASLSLLLMLVDAVLIPGLVQRARANEPRPVVAETEPQFVEDPPPEIPGAAGSIARGIDQVVATLGELVAYWSVLAVFAYFFEVVGRYVFNSPTNWVHESTFLMFGMQYMIAGAYAYRGESHVRVDLIYSHLSPRGKAICDIIGSVFFFIFIGTMTWTGWTFASQAMASNEVSFSEWGIQYWPVKLMIPIGALLMMMVGIARLIKDFHTLATAKG